MNTNKGAWVDTIGRPFGRKLVRCRAVPVQYQYVLAVRCATGKTNFMRRPAASRMGWYAYALDIPRELVTFSLRVRGRREHRVLRARGRAFSERRNARGHTNRVGARTHSRNSHDIECHWRWGNRAVTRGALNVLRGVAMRVTRNTERSGEK